jgi:non-heme chloroperoxidase
MSKLKTASGVKLRVNDWGKGKPVVLIHGWPVSLDMWENQAVALASEGFRVIAYDRRGFGHSEQPFTGYDYDTLAGDLSSVIDGLDLRDAVLVGFSMGGGEVARYLGRYGSERVAKAVFVSAVTPFLLKTKDNPAGVDKSVFDGIVENIKADRPKFLASFAKAFYGVGLVEKPVSDELLAWNAALALQGSLKATLDCVRAFSETDFRADLRKIQIPTLFIHGDADKTVPIDASAREAVKLVRGATLIEYAGAPHGLFVTEKDRLSRDLITFCR